MLRIDPHSVIAHRQLPAATPPAYEHFYLRAFRAELDRIGEQIEYGPAHQVAIATHEVLNLLTQLRYHLDGNAPRPGQSPGLIHRLLRHQRQIEFDELSGIDRFGAHQAQQVVGEIQRRAGIAADAIEHLLVLRQGRIERVRPFHHGDDRRQRRSQVVRKIVHGFFAPDLYVMHRGDVVDTEHHAALAAALIVQPGHGNEQIGAAGRLEFDAERLAVRRRLGHTVLDRNLGRPGQRLDGGSDRLRAIGAEQCGRAPVVQQHLAAHAQHQGPHRQVLERIDDETAQLPLAHRSHANEVDPGLERVHAVAGIAGIEFGEVPAAAFLAQCLELFIQVAVRGLEASPAPERISEHAPQNRTRGRNPQVGEIEQTPAQSEYADRGDKGDRERISWRQSQHRQHEQRYHDHRTQRHWQRRQVVNCHTAAQCREHVGMHLDTGHRTAEPRGRRGHDIAHARGRRADQHDLVSDRFGRYPTGQ